MRVLLSLLCVIILATRIAGAHLHLCLDGMESPASVQLDADTSHRESEDGAGKRRHDLDLSLAGEALAKKFDGALELPALLGATVLLLIAFAASLPLILDSDARPLPGRPLYRIRPPLRGPPLQAFRVF